MTRNKMEKRLIKNVDKSSVSARYCILQCVRLIAGGGGGGVEWVVESTRVTHFQCRLMGSFTSPGIDTR